MRTSVDIPDDIFRHAKMVAARDGTTMRELIVDGLRDRVGLPAKKEDNWDSFFGILKDDPEAVAEFNRIIEEEFEQIDPEDWK